MDDALTLVQKNEERLSESELYRLKGELLLAQDPTQLQAAESYFRQALCTARRQMSKIQELRALMSLSRLWQQQGQSDKARFQLAKITNWFTEGRNTVDFQAAQTLLDCLDS